MKSEADASPPRRVAITGVGVVTPLGCHAAGVREAIGRGESAVGRVTRFDPAGFEQADAAEVAGFDARPFFRVPKALKLCDAKTRFAVAAAALALRDAGFSSETGDLDRLGVVIGSSGSDFQAEDLARAVGESRDDRAASEIPLFAERILSGLNPLWLLVNLPNMASAHVSIQLGARGPNSTILTDWIAGTQAIGEAALWIREGEADAVLAGGSDTGVLPFFFGSCSQSGLFGAPEGAERFVPGEGAALFLLEEYERALAREARIYGEVCAYAASSSPPDAEENALARSMRWALQEAGWDAREVTALFCASAPARHLEEERAALAAVFDRDSKQFPPQHFRRALGHALAASGPIDLALALPPAAALESHILASSLGFSGQAATLAVRSGPWVGPSSA